MRILSSAKALLRILERNLYRFIVGKRVIPPAYAVKRATIEEYAKDFATGVLVETGTYLGETIDAVKGAFSRVVSIELDTELFKKAKVKFSAHPHISILHGDSSRILPIVLASIHEPALFWLDGHYSGTGTAKGESNTPILSELKAILDHPIKDHVILIDDARCFIGENGYPSVKDLVSFIHKTGGDRRFAVEDDIIRILPREKVAHAYLSTYKEPWRAALGRQYRRLRQPTKRFFFGEKNERTTSRPEITAVRNFWDARPCNIRHSPKPVGTREYFDEVETRKYFVEPHIPGFADFARWRGKRVLEIGCGIGTDAVNFARAGADYTGVELSRASLEVAQQRFQTFGLTGRFREANAEQLADLFPGETFDLIYSFGVIHHAPHPERIVAQAARLMHPDSEFRLMLYARRSWKNILVRLGLDQPEAQFGCPIADTFSPKDIRKLLTGFDIVDMRQEHIFKYRIGAYRQYRYETVPWFAWMPDLLFRGLEKALGWHTLIRCKLEKPQA